MADDEAGGPPQDGPVAKQQPLRVALWDAALFDNFSLGSCRG
jgi:hypothetical protein